MNLATSSVLNYFLIMITYPSLEKEKSIATYFFNENTVNYYD